MQNCSQLKIEQQPYINIPFSKFTNHRLLCLLRLATEPQAEQEGTAHPRIYCCLFEMCCLVFFTGENIRKATAQGKMKQDKIVVVFCAVYSVIDCNISNVALYEKAFLIPKYREVLQMPNIDKRKSRNTSAFSR